jgi:hypothetical protein
VAAAAPELAAAGRRAAAAAPELAAAGRRAAAAAAAGREPQAPLRVAWSRGQAWLWATVLLTAGAFAVTIGAAPAAGSDPARGLTWLLFVGSSMHVAATGWLYTLGEVRGHARANMPRYVWVPLALVAGTAATAAAVAPASFRWLLLGYFAWQFVHFQKQNLGMAALAASSSQVRGPGVLERRALVCAGLAGTAGAVAHPGLLQLDVAHGLEVAFPIAGAAFAVAVAVGGLALCSRPRADRPAGYVVVFLGALLFFAPVFLCGSPYAAVGTLTIAHGLQYLLLAGLVTGGGERVNGRPRAVRVVVLVNLAVIGGVALSAASHLHDGSPGERLLFGAYLGAAMAHFVVDAGLWRLRDEFPRQFLSARVPYLVKPRATPGSLADRSVAELP